MDDAGYYRGTDGGIPYLERPVSFAAFMLVLFNGMVPFTGSIFSPLQREVLGRSVRLLVGAQRTSQVPVTAVRAVAMGAWLGEGGKYVRLFLGLGFGPKTQSTSCLTSM